MTPAEIRRTAYASIQQIKLTGVAEDEDKIYKQVEVLKLQLLLEIAAQFSAMNELFYKMYQEEQDEKLQKVG